MRIIRTYVPNSQENYNHLVYCEKTNVAAAIDPYDAQHLLDVANDHRLTITQIWITHEHGDHIREVVKLKSMTNASVLAPKACQGAVKADSWLDDAQVISLGDDQVTHYATPGHTPGHGIYLYQSNNQLAHFVVCADTLFNAGVGNVYSGDVNVLYDTVQSLQSIIPDSAELYSGHDYMVNNLRFVLHYFPRCEAAATLLTSAQACTSDTRPIQTFGQEKQYNPFLCLQAKWLSDHSELTNLDKKNRFIQLREWRNQW